MRDDLPPEVRRRLQREYRRRLYMRRRLAALGVVLAVIGVVAAVAVSLGSGGSSSSRATTDAATKKKHKPAAPVERQRPKEVRGIHVTMSLASIPGKIDQYLSLRKHGLNTLEVDLKDESGEVGFVNPDVPLARKVGAAHPYYDPYQIAEKAHANGVYLIGRVVTFEDPVLSEKRPGLALKNPDGTVWHTNAGLGWTNEYDKRVWKYNVDIGAAAARAGFDEIQFDYVRFPSDGDVSLIVYKGKVNEDMGWTIARFAHYAGKRLHKLGVRVGTDLFGLAANHNLGIGQYPARIGRFVDTISPMAYPSHYGPGEYNLPDPDAAPGRTVYRTLEDFNRKLQGRKAVLVPWLQDFSLGRSYTFEDVEAQVAASRRAHTAGFLLWNAEGLYTAQALSPYGPYGESRSTTQPSSPSR